MRKDVSSRSGAQDGISPAAATPADAPCLHPEESKKEVEGDCPEGNVNREVEEQVPKGPSLAQDTGDKQDRVCG